ncbi:hypothetical protein TKK_0014499 [Trichogramma kaykai]
MESGRMRLRSNPQRKRSIGRVRHVVFKGNQYTEPYPTPKLLNAKKRSAEESAIYEKSASTLKLQTQTCDFEAGPAQYRLIDFSIFLPFLQENLKCNCGGKINIVESSVGGLGFMVNIEWDLCESSPSITSSKKNRT